MNDAEVLIRFKGNTDDAIKATDDVKSNLDDLSKKGELAFAGLTAAADAFATSILKGGINYNAQIETYMTRLETLTGSAENAEEVLTQIKEDALKTPFDVASLTQAESLLLSTGLSADDARKDILALGDAVSASGGGNAELQRMAVNLQQIKNVGKASALDIKQFAYAGIDIYGLLADYMGITREEASQLDVTYNMLSGALQEAAAEGGKYYGAMEKQSQTYNGQMSNLKESLDVLKGELAKELFEAFKKIIPELTKFFNWVKKNQKVIKAIAIPLLTFTNVLTGILIAKKIATAVKALWLVMSANPIGVVVAAIAALVAGFIYLWNNCEEFRNFWIGLWNKIKEVVEPIVNFMKDIFDKIFKAVKKVIDKIMQVVQPIIDFYVDIYTKIYNFLKEFIEKYIKIITDIIQKVMEIVLPIVEWIWNNLCKPLIDFFMNTFGKIFEDVVTIFNKIKDTISTIFNWVKDNIISPLINFFGDVFGRIYNTIKDAFQKAYNFCKKLFENLFEILKAPFNLIIDAINVVIDALNKINIKVPKWVPGIGGKKFGFNIQPLQPLATGTNYVPQDMVAMIHEGEAVVPKKFNPYANNMNMGTFSNRPTQTIIVYANFKQNSLGQTVRDIKTFSGGARNDYNYGVGV